MITERHQADKREEKTNRSGYKMQQLNKEQSGQKKLPKAATEREKPSQCGGWATWPAHALSLITLLS